MSEEAWYLGVIALALLVFITGLWLDTQRPPIEQSRDAQIRNCVDHTRRTYLSMEEALKACTESYLRQHPESKN